ncbi:MAG: hypothetical protein IKX46_06175 [Verrucomicrobia bacterium]|nr:hypothetical protein [Verrucomicrobiota bacterium]MBR6460210.1 hypothetical protein [Verrucomicrobiota bacterium]
MSVTMESRGDTVPQGKSEIAFLPFTFGGIAHFGYARKAFLFTVELVIALFCSLSILWFVCDAYFPIVGQAIDSLPEEEVSITNNRLVWDERDGVLAQSSKLAISINAYGGPKQLTDSDLTLELAMRSFKLHCINGYYTEIPYQIDRFPLNRQRVTSWWKAWMGPLIFWIIFISFCSLVFVWQILSFLYMFGVKIIAWAARRQVEWTGAYMLSGASLMPGALLMTAGIFCYSIGCISLEGLGIIAAAHIGLAWIFLLISSLLLPKAPKPVPVFKQSQPRDNFESPAAVREPEESPVSVDRNNPFSGQKPAKKSSFFGRNKQNPFS